MRFHDQSLSSLQIIRESPATLHWYQGSCFPQNFWLVTGWRHRGKATLTEHCRNLVWGFSHFSKAQGHLCALLNDLSPESLDQKVHGSQQDPKHQLTVTNHCKAHKGSRVTGSVYALLAGVLPRVLWSWRSLASDGQVLSASSWADYKFSLLLTRICQSPLERPKDLGNPFCLVTTRPSRMVENCTECQDLIMPQGSLHVTVWASCWVLALSEAQHPERLDHFKTR